jgi:hypothetical protein
MYTTVINTTVSQDLDFAYATSKSINSSAKLSVNEDIPTGVNDVQFNFNFSTGSGVFLSFASNIALYPLIVKTNDSINPTNYFEVRATNQHIYYNFSTDKDSNGSPILDIQTLYISNTGELPASLRIDSLFDITPLI